MISISLAIFKDVQQPVVHLGAGEVQVCAVPCSALQRSCKALQRRAVQRPLAAPEASRLAESKAPRLLAVSSTLGLVLLLNKIAQKGLFQQSGSIFDCQ